MALFLSSLEKNKKLCMRCLQLIWINNKRNTFINNKGRSKAGARIYKKGPQLRGPQFTQRLSIFFLFAVFAHHILLVDSLKKRRPSPKSPNGASEAHNFFSYTELLLQKIASKRGKGTYPNPYIITLISPLYLTAKNMANSPSGGREREF